MKIILRQFLVVNPDNNEEQRTRLTFAQLHKKFKRGIVYLEQCEIIPQKGFIYEGKNYRRVLIGTLGRKLTFEDYVKAKQKREALQNSLNSFGLTNLTTIK